MGENFSKIFNVSLIYATFRASTPIIYAALCAAITQQANILNIGTEGIMLVGAFTAVAVSYLTGSWILGILSGSRRSQSVRRLLDDSVSTTTRNAGCQQPIL